MIWTESKKDTVMISWLPFQEFKTLLKRGIQYIDRTIPQVNILYLVIGKFSSSEEIIRRYVLRIGHVVVNIGGITSSHGSQVLSNAILPAKRQVNQHGTGNFRDRADQPFSYTILMMHVDNKIANTLIMIMNMLNKTILSEDSVISKISIDHNSIIQTHFFIVLFGSNSF